MWVNAPPPETSSSPPSAQRTRVRSYRERVRGEVGLHADDRLDAGGGGLAVEVVGAEDVAVVGHRERRHAHARRSRRTARSAGPRRRASSTRCARAGARTSRSSPEVTAVPLRPLAVARDPDPLTGHRRRARGGRASLSTSGRPSPRLASQQGIAGVSPCYGAKPGRVRRCGRRSGRADQRYRNAIAFSGRWTHPCEPCGLVLRAAVRERLPGRVVEAEQRGVERDPVLHRVGRAGVQGQRRCRGSGPGP